MAVIHVYFKARASGAGVTTPPTEEGENYRAGSHWRHYASAPEPAPYSLRSCETTWSVGPATRSKAKTTGLPSVKKPTTSVTSRDLPEAASLSFRNLIDVAHSEERALKIQYRNASGRVSNRVVDILGVGTNLSMRSTTSPTSNARSGLTGRSRPNGRVMDPALQRCILRASGSEDD